MAAAPEASAAFLDLLNTCLIYAHGLVADSQALLLALTVAASALCQSTRELCRSAVTLLAHLFSPGPRAAASPAWGRYASHVPLVCRHVEHMTCAMGIPGSPGQYSELLSDTWVQWECDMKQGIEPARPCLRPSFRGACRIREQLNAAVMEHGMGEKVAGAVVLGIAGTLPREAIRSAAGVLRELLQMGGTAAGEAWLDGALRQPQFAEAAGGRIGEREVRIFRGCCLAAPPLPKQLFSAVMLDFGLVCRAEATSEQLLAYEERVTTLQQVVSYILS